MSVPNFPRAIGARAQIILSVAAAAASLGCSPATSTPAHVPLTGKVTYNSQPIANGLLVLQPSGAGQPVSTAIFDGQYGFSKNNGPFAGRYHAVITRTGAEETAPVNRGFGPGGRNFPPPKRPVDRAGQKNSFELDVEIVAADPAVRDFELKD